MSLEEDDEEDDKPMNGNRNKKSGHHNGLNFDSDEDKEGNELITLDNDTNRDRTGTAADKIPKL